MQSALLSLSIGTCFSASLLLIVLAVPKPILHKIFGIAAADLLIWLPVVLLAASLYQALYAWAVRCEAFQLLARNKFILGAATAGLQIGIGLTDPGPIGFVLAQLGSQSLALGLLVGLFSQGWRRVSPERSYAALAERFRLHIALPLYTMPANLVNMLSTFTPDFLINSLFGTAPLGQYALANRVVNFPLAFVSTAVQDIFRQQATREFNETGTCRIAFTRFFLLMSGMAIFVLLPVIALLPWLVPIVFGPDWDQAGHLIQALAILITIRFVSSPLSYVWIIRGRQRLDLMWQIGLLILGLLGFFVPLQLWPELSIERALWVFSLVLAAWYLVALTVSWRLAVAKVAPPERSTTLVSRTDGTV